MQRLPPRQHRDERRDPSRARLRSLRGLDAVQDRVAVLGVQRREERRRLRRRVERRTEVVRHGRGARRVVGSVPAPVRLRALDLAQARRLHPPRLDQRLREPAVALGPHAPRASRREALLVPRLVDTAGLAVDPPEPQRLLERLHVRDGRDPRALAREPDPHARRRGVVPAQPRLPLGDRGERERVERGTGGRHRPQATLAAVSGAAARGEPEPWAAAPPLVALVGRQGAAAFCAMFETFPEAVGLLWAIRDAARRIVDFDFGYGNPAIMRMFRLPRTQAGRYTVLEALPQMRADGTFDRYAQVFDTGEPWVDEISFDTPFGDGHIRGTFLRRTAKLGDGLIVLMTDVTAQRRMEAELRGFADMVAHDLREPVTGIAHLVTLLERRAETPPDPAVLDLLKASTERARELIDGVLAYARAGELDLAPVELGALMDDVAADLRPRLDEAGATLEVDALPEVLGD